MTLPGKKGIWVSATIGVTFLVSVIFPVDLWIVHLLRSSSFLTQSLSLRHPLAIFYASGKLLSFIVIFSIIVFLSINYKVFYRLTPDKWTEILFFNASWLWLYTMIIEFSVKFFYSDLFLLPTGPAFSMLGILYGFNGFIATLAKLMLVIASTRFLVTIKPVNYNA